MKKTITLIVFVALLSVSMLYVGCKKSDQVITNTLTVRVSEGVVGTPTTGSYAYSVGDTVPYSYELQTGYTGLTVLLDNLSVPATGSITITGNNNLQAYSAGNALFTLTVTVGTGINGTPVTGTYSYKEGSVVDYSYSIGSDYYSLAVTLNGTTVENSGTITMSKNLALIATATKKYNVLGAWTLTEAYTDGSAFTGTITFSGTIDAGAVVDTAGGAGTFALTDNTLSFNLVFPNVSYLYVGSFSSDTKMTGSSKRSKSSTVYYSGSWTATKVTTSAVSHITSTGKDDN